jgi:hypothetical protein
MDASHPPDGASESGITSPYAAAVFADSPAGYWRLGDLVGSTTAHDSSGHGHDGTVVGGVTFGVAGALAHDTDTAAQFDGVSGSINLGPAFTFIGSAPFTWELWIKPAVLDANYRPIMSSMTFDAQGNPSAGTYMVDYSVSGTDFGFERYQGGNSVIALDTTGLTTGTWTYVVATSDALGNGIVYVNGAAVLADTNVGSVAAYTASTVLGLAGGAAFKGVLDEVAIYDSALSASRIQAHWVAGSQ